MASSNVPVRVPERPASTEAPASRPAIWRQDKKSSRFIIKIGGIVPC
jgi:hypothetical protein